MRRALPIYMFHHVARVRRPHLMFRFSAEAAWLWGRIGRIRDLAGLVLMPDHLHLLHPSDVREELAHVLSGYVRWRRCADPQAAGFEPLPAAEPLVDAQKRRRSLRYVHLNPCRAGLVADPLEWPFSTHRDALGLVAHPPVERDPEPARLHRYVSSDPTVNVQGTDLPMWRRGPFSTMDVLVATSAALRLPIDDIASHVKGRDAFIRAAKQLYGSSLLALAGCMDRCHMVRIPAEWPGWPLRRPRRACRPCP